MSIPESTNKTARLDDAGLGTQPNADSLFDPSPSVGKAADAEVVESLAPGTLLGDYRINQELGRGGMGVVYRAHDLRRDRPVALKTLQRVSPKALQAFKREFRALADVAHPNLIAYYELTAHEDLWFFTMEIVDGVHFRQYILDAGEPQERTPAKEKTAAQERVSNSGNDPVARQIDDAPAHTVTIAPSDGGEDKSRIESEAALDTKPSPDPLDATLQASSPLHKAEVLSASRPSPPVRLTASQIERLTDALDQLAAGLTVLHQAGLLHRDIKPANVMATREGRVLLLDFGLTAKTGDSQNSSITGTIPYMSPEQAGGGVLGPPSDWYAVGVMIYEALCGRRPFEGDVWQILAAKQTAEPPALAEIDAPKPLKTLCEKLLHRDPRRRWEAVRRAGWGEGVELDDESGKLADILVGRAELLQQLQQSYGVFCGGRAQNLFVHGASGMGKSTLVDAFLRQVRQQTPRAVVLSGRCYQQESVPFKALDSLIDSLSVHLAKLPRKEAAAIAPPDASALLRVFPVLGGVPAFAATGPAMETDDQQELRRRAMAGLRELLKRLGRRAPLVLHIDDLQWGDEDSGELLAYLVRRPDPPLMMLLGAYRSEDDAESVFLQKLEEAYRQGDPPHRQQLFVGPLPHHQAKQLALTLLGEWPEAQQRAETIARESQGGPFFIRELVRSFQEAPDRAAAGGLDETLWTRALRLPETARRLLETIAVNGRPLAEGEAYQAADLGERGPAALGQLTAAQFLRVAGDNQVEAYHDRIRESVVAHLAPDARRRLHRRLAETFRQTSSGVIQQVRQWVDHLEPYCEVREPPALEKSQWERVFGLARHYDEAGMAEEVPTLVFAAAVQALSQNALEIAESQYEIFARSSRQASTSMRFWAAEGLGDALLLRAKYEAAEQQFQVAAKLAPDSVTQARIECKRSEIPFKQGNLQQTDIHLEAALNLLGQRIPRSKPAVLAAALKQVAVQVWRTKFPSRLHRLPAEGSETRLMIARIFCRLSYTYWFSRGPFPTVWAHFSGMNLAERCQPSLELAHIYSTHAGFVALQFGMYDRAVKYAERALEIGREKGSLWGQGIASFFFGVVYLSGSRFREGIQAAGEGVELLEQAGYLWDSNMSRWHLLYCQYHLGDLEAAIRESQKMYDIGERLGDVQTMAFALPVWAMAADGEIPEALVRAELERERIDALTVAQVRLAEGLRLAKQERLDEAVEMLQLGLDDALKAGVNNAFVSPLYTWLATMLRRLANERPADRQGLLKRARKWVKKAVKRGRTYQNELPHALRESGELALLRGQTQQAKQWFRESLAVAERLGMIHEQAKTRQAGEAIL